MEAADFFETLVSTTTHGATLQRTTLLTATAVRASKLRGMAQQVITFVKLGHVSDES
jgi:hypothetical protein